MKVEIVVGAARGELVGEAPGVLVFAGGACDTATGELVETTGEPPATQADSLVDNGARVFVRDRAAWRRHDEGWTEQLFEVPAGAQIAFTDTLLAMFHGDTLQLAGTHGGVAWLKLPAWLADGDVVVTVAPRARAVVLVSRRTCWFTWDALAAAYGAAGGTATIVAVLPGTVGDGEVIVTKGSVGDAYTKRTIVIEDRAGKRFTVKTFACKPVATGEHLTLRDVDQAFPVLRRDGDWIRVEELTPLTDGDAAPMFPTFTSRVGSYVTRAANARRLVSAKARARIVALRDLGIVAISDDALDAAITHAFGGDNMAGRHGAVTAGTILWAHASLAPSEQFLVGEAAQLAGEGWWLVETWRERSLAARFDDRALAAIEAEGLLLLVPAPANLPLPATCAEAVAELAQRIGAPIDWTGDAEGRMTLSIHAAALLERCL